MDEDTEEALGNIHEVLGSVHEVQVIYRRWSIRQDRALLLLAVWNVVLTVALLWLHA